MTTPGPGWSGSRVHAARGAIQFPALGSLVAHESTTDLPGFARVGGREAGGTALGGGFLGLRFSPLVVTGGRQWFPQCDDEGNGNDLRVHDLDRAGGVSTAA